MSMLFKEFIDFIAIFKFKLEYEFNNNTRITDVKTQEILNDSNIHREVYSSSKFNNIMIILQFNDKIFNITAYTCDGTETNGFYANMSMLDSEKRKVLIYDQTINNNNIMKAISNTTNFLNQLLQNEENTKTGNFKGGIPITKEKRETTLKDEKTSS